MDLLQVILPTPDNFYILLNSGEKIRILKYTSINIDFSERIAYRNGVQEIIRDPWITYIVKLDDAAKNQLKQLFSNAYSSNMCTVQSRDARIKVGDKGYIFKAQVFARPDMQNSFLLPEKFNDIKIFLKLENTNISLFDQAEKAYENYRINNRFEILDL